jgi:rubrerythrin
MTEEHNSLELLIRHELALKRLYELFAMAFPELRAFWEGIAQEEQIHSDCLQNLSSTESMKKWSMTDMRFKQLAIHKSIEYIETQMERTKKTDISLLEALSIAHDLEESLIEKQFISLNVSGPEEIRNVMKGLVADTQRHRKMILETLNFRRRKA